MTTARNACPAAADTRHLDVHALPQAQWPVGLALLALLDRVLPDRADAELRASAGGRAPAQHGARPGTPISA